MDKQMVLSLVLGVVLLVSVAQALQLSSLNAQVQGLSLGSGTAVGLVSASGGAAGASAGVAAAPVQGAPASGGLPSQVGGC